MAKGNRGGRRGGGSGFTGTQEPANNAAEQKSGFMFDAKLFKTMPKSVQPYITGIYKDRDAGEWLYSATIKFADGFTRSLSEYGKVDFVDYVKNVCLEDRELQM